MPLYINTPLLESRPLSIISGHTVWLKMEALQPSGSFKLRGISFACLAYHKRGATRFISSSGGNAGIAVAYVGRRINIPVTVVVPKTTSHQAIKLLQQEQADVIVEGESWQDANAYALSITTANAAFIHPFDDPLLWAGHATLIDEIAISGLKPDAIILSVGGGGLLAGAAIGLLRNNWSDIPIIAVETKGTASYHAAIKANQPVDIGKVSGVATSLAARKVCEQAVNVRKELTINSFLVTDEEAINACRNFLDDHRILVEPACGASLACLYEAKIEFKHYKNILVIVCGGATMTLDQLALL